MPSRNPQARCLCCATPATRNHEADRDRMNIFNVLNVEAESAPVLPSINVLTDFAQPGRHALQDYQLQLMLLERQNKKRLIIARHGQDSLTAPPSDSFVTPAPYPQPETVSSHDRACHHYESELMLLQQENKKRLGMAQHGQDLLATPQPSTAFALQDQHTHLPNTAPVPPDQLLDGKSTAVAPSNVLVCETVVEEFHHPSMLAS